MKCVVSQIWAIRPEIPDYPELVDSWDEYQIENWPEGWDDVVKEAKALDYYTDVRVIDVVVDYDVVQASFRPAKIEGEVRG